MPVLRNARQERFCQLIKRGIPPYRAYPEAGYSFNNGSPYRLQENARVKARIIEITRSIAVKTRVTVESITTQLDEDRALAVRVDQPGAAIQATVAKAKLHGLLIDRKESGAPGDFAAAQTPEQVIAKVREELGEEAAAALQALVGGPAAAPEPAEAPITVEYHRDETTH